MGPYDVIVIGAGAAGLMAAIEAGKRGRSVLVVDHAGSMGKKIRISGGGRCNFGNTAADHHNYMSHNPLFCKSALARFTVNDFIGLLEKHGIAWEEREQGQLFCVRESGEIVKMLAKECSGAGVKLLLNCRISSVDKKEIFSVITDKQTFVSDSLIIATGGLSYPQLGATGLGYKIARQFGINVLETKPALVPFVFKPQDSAIFDGLSGISFEAIVRCRGREFQGGILFTHEGLSGPAMLQISTFWDRGEPLVLDVAPGIDAQEEFSAKQQSAMEMPTLLSRFLPKRFARKWCELYGYSRPMRSFNKKEIMEVSRRIHEWEIIPARTEDYRTAEVTSGGVDTDELSSKTMESKKVSGLFFAGEVIDVTGQLGGYNLQWAWSSGFAAGQYA
ncbi:MAG: NAD(P)/FAD-dependent oxidoreductase [Nitrospirae bacterium]|nr:NAD(P)/FAD-dependent oxidoreductase [Nitrospirota bacterium]